jgi:putative phage-type endonuclease
MVATTCSVQKFETEAEWLEARKQYVTASEIACVVGLDAYKSPLRLYHEKRGEIDPPDLSGNAAVQAGKALEGTILDIYQQEAGRKVDRCEPFRLFVNSDYPMIAATPDGFDWRDEIEQEGVVDAKNIGLRMAKHWDDGAPEGYRLQIHQQMIVTGAKCGSLAALIGGQDFRYFDYARSERLSDVIVNRAAEFMERVRKGKEPETDGSKDCAALLRELFPEDNGEDVVLPVEAAELYDTMLVHQREADLAAAKLAAIKNQVRRWMGPATHGYLPDGTLAFTHKTVKKAAYKVKAQSYRDLRRKS